METQYFDYTFEEDKLVFDNTIIYKEHIKQTKPFYKPVKQVVFKPKNIAKLIEYDPDKCKNLI